MIIKVLLEDKPIEVDLDTFRHFLYTNTPLKSKELDFVMRELPEFFHPNRLTYIASLKAS